MNKKFFRPLSVALGMLALQCGRAQVSTPNNSPFTGDYVGCDGGTLFPLEVRHNGNQPIQWFTDSIQRMQLWHSPAPATIGSFGGIRQNGFLGISQQPLFFTTAQGPFSRIHLVDSTSNTLNDYAQPFGYRPWQRNGVAMSGNRDQMYMGQKYTYSDVQDPTSGEMLDRCDAVIQWSDNKNDGNWPTDRFRLLFTAGYNAANPAQFGGRSLEGLESFRVFVPNDTSANVGIGDFFRASVLNGGIAVDPTERLDVLDGRVRIRQLPTDPQANTLDQYMVVDPNGVVGWRNLPTSATTNCEWVPFPGVQRLATGYLGSGTNGSCPDRRWLYGIGVSTPTYKLAVDHSEVDRVADGGISSNYKVNSTHSTSVFGMKSTVGPVTGGDNYGSGFGVQSTVTGADHSIGVEAISNVNSASTSSGEALGVKGRVIQTAGSLIKGYGVYGEVVTNGGNTDPRGVFGNAYATGTNGSVYGVYGKAFLQTGTATNLFGIYGTASGSGSLGTNAITNCYSVYGLSSAPVSPVNVQNNYGVWGKAVNGAINYGVYGEAQDTATNNWAGYFKGKLRITGNGYVSGNVLITSDENLKTDIEDLTGSSEILAQLNPKTYYFRSDEHPSLNLPGGQQVGLIAQELEQVLPSLVGEVVDPAVIDSMGVVLWPEEQTKAINYIGLVPVLIGAAQEQQAQVDELVGVNADQEEELRSLRDLLTEQNARMDHLEQLLAACCANPDAQFLQEGGLNNGTLPNDPLDDRKLRIQPNPFSESTTVYYTLERSGRTQLIANSADGKELRVLQEASLEGGSYQYEWNTADLAAGVYYVTLLLDGQPVVKKAVKVSR